MNGKRETAQPGQLFSRPPGGLEYEPDSDQAVEEFFAGCSLHVPKMFIRITEVKTVSVTQ